jgi:Major Facilitator Superfamily
VIDGTPTTTSPLDVPLRRNRNFTLLWVGQVLSDLGSQIGTLAYPLLILALTHSAVIAGAVGTVAAAGAFVVRLPAGALADRLDRRSTMIVCDAVRAAALAVLAALVVLGAAAWPVVMVVALLDRALDTLFTPASTAALPAIVADRQLEAAWAANEGRQYAANLAGPPLGGLLFAIGRPVPFLADAVSYGISMLASLALRGEFRPAPRGDTHDGLWSEAFDGVRLLWRNDVLRSVLLRAPLMNFAFTGAIFTVTLGLRQHGWSASVVGLAQAVIMAGGLAGAIAAPWIQKRITVSQSILLLTITGACLMGAAALVMPSPAVAVLLAIPLILSPAANASLFAAMLREAPEEMRGRVNNALFQVALGLATLAPLASGAIIAAASAGWAMALFATTLALLIPLLLVLPAVR